MKKIDLNIKIDDLILGDEFKNKKGFDVSKQYIDIAFVLYQSRTDMRGQPTGMPMNEQRKVYKILDNLDNMKNGILELEDDRYDFLKKVFSEVNWVGGTKIVVRIADRIDEADKVNELDKANKADKNSQ